MFLDASYKNEEINNKNNIAITNIKQRKISMSGITTRGNLNSSDPYNLYYDINVVTDYDPTLTGDTSPALTFTETRPVYFLILRVPSRCISSPPPTSISQLTHSPPST